MSKSAIITIGDELISGYRIDTNSKWLSQRLSEINIKNLSVTSVGDDRESIIQAVSNESSKSFVKYVFITGGIGPTKDDCTYDAVKYFLKSSDYLDEDYFNELKNKFKSNHEIPKTLLKKQAMKLKKVQYLSNPTGTALPMFFVKNKITFFVLPGVPSEIEEIYIQNILPMIDKEKSKQGEVTLKFVGISESLLHEKLEDVLKKYHYDIKFSFLPNLSRITLRLVNVSKDEKILKEAKKNVLSQLGKYYLGEGDVTLESVVLKMLIGRKITLSLAESCTGGYISKLITDYSGSSKVFKGSIVAYSNKVKENDLSISKGMLKKYGAVSFEVAEQMSQNIAKKMNTDIGLSVTGISGPNGGTKLKPVGLVYISITYLNKSITKKFKFSNNRKTHRLMTASAALNILRLILVDKLNFNDKKNN